jgi:predicted component of type VI protein secretion system
MSASYQLVMKSAPYPDKEFPLTRDEMTVGRDTANEIVISDAEVSRRHARIYKVGETFMIEDLGSTNGTFVNGQRLAGPHALQPGETVRFGETITLLFEAPAQSYDPNATMMTPGGSFNLPQAAPATFTGSIPEGSGSAGGVTGEVPAKKNNNRTLILVGVGCLVLLCCVCAVGAFAFDYFNLYYLIGM